MINKFIRYNQLNCNHQFKRFTSRFTSGPRPINVQFSDGTVMKIECDKYGLFADGSAVGTIGGTSVSVTAVSVKNLSKPTPFVPLMVNYQQKAASVARIPTNFLRRDRGTTEHEILTGRLIDRSIRPFFPAGYNYETQVVCKLVASDRVNGPDVAAINAASAALHFSDIPWNGPIGAVRIATKDDQIVINPNRQEIDESDFNIVVTSDRNKSVLMLEGLANCVTPLKHVYKAIECGVEENLRIIDALDKAKEDHPIAKRSIEKYFLASPELVDSVKMLSENRFHDILSNSDHDKVSRGIEINELSEKIIRELAESSPDVEQSLVSQAIIQIEKQIFHQILRQRQRRFDARSFTDLRDIECEVDLFKPLHGSSIFRRGQTRVMSSLTLDSIETSLKTDAITALTGGPSEKNFFLHYEFPSYATGETGSVGSYGRREIGHGALAERALRPAIPEDFPFALRLDCEVLESNGSSSMASVCAGSLALMDGGIPVNHATAGVAMGLIYDPVGSEDENYIVLTDIMGLEDFLGEMDFKMAGNENGLTSIIVDVKLSSGLPLKVVKKALEQGLDANVRILDIMSKTIKEPRQEKKDNWPVSESIEVPPHRRSRLFTAGNKVMKKLSADLGARLTQDEQDPNKFILYAPNRTSFDEALETVNQLISMDDYEKKLEFKAIYNAQVVDVVDSGVKVVLHPGMDPAFIPNRELELRPIKHPSAIGVTVGSEIFVKYFGRDPVSGQMRLSRRAVQAVDPLRKDLLNNRKD
ncbi:polyribonucleotide nucleotidyltransferase 1 [Brevipalpus obovatus]|uniref:polyribonucleotide nucleotidyltransferase 1 n=1 Tax=Brevipalpus obovatus TaxID=246614 RepID=UPI003D9E0EE3